MIRLPYIINTKTVEDEAAQGAGHQKPWASYQIREIAGNAPGTFSPQPASKETAS